MKIYKDVFSGDELFSDIYPIVEQEGGAVLRVQGKLTIETTDTSGINTGANASEEAPDEATDDTCSSSGVNIVLANRLVECPMTKKGCKEHLVMYMKELKKKLEEDEYKDVDGFKTNCQKFVQKVIGEFKEYQFYMGESTAHNGMLCLMKWEEETPYMYFFKQGLEEEKV